MTSPETDHAPGRQPDGRRPGWVADLIGLLARLVLGGVLLVAGALKVADLDQSREATRAYQLLPATLADLVGSILPFAEVALGVLLILGLLTRGSAILSGLLMLAFVAAVGSAWARGLRIDCGCFGGGGTVAPDRTAYAQEIVRDLALVLLAAWLAWRPRTLFSLDRRLWG